MFKTTIAKTAEEYIENIEDPERKKEVKKLDELIRKTVPNLESFIISGMIGYGPYQYKSKSGKTGQWAKVLLASQKNYISVYACGVSENGEYIAEQYGKELSTKDTSKKHPKVSVGKSCIRFKKIEDLDLDVLKTVLKQTEKSPLALIQV